MPVVRRNSEKSSSRVMSSGRGRDVVVEEEGGESAACSCVEYTLHVGGRLAFG